MSRKAIEHTKIRNTQEWEDFRLKCIKDADMKCECCGIRKKTSRALQLHHINPDTVNYSDFSNRDNYAVLCPTCHQCISRFEGMKRETFESLNTNYKELFRPFIGKFRNEED